MGDKLRLIIAIFWRAAIIFLPMTEVAFAALERQSPFLSNSYVRDFAAMYSDVILIVGSLFLLAAGSTIGYFFPTPQYGAKPLPKPIKLLISVVGGFLAFAFYVHTEKTITPAVIWWVAAVSFVSPAIIHLVHAAAIKFTGIRFGIVQQDLDSIKKSFNDEKEGS